jgi:hypothetical protein
MLCRGTVSKGELLNGLFAHAFYTFFMRRQRIIIAALSHGVNAVKSFGYGSIALLVLSLKYTLQFVNLGVAVQWRFLHLLISTTLSAGTLFSRIETTTGAIN